MTGVYPHSTPASQVAAMELVGTHGDRIPDKISTKQRLRKIGSVQLLVLF